MAIFLHNQVKFSPILLLLLIACFSLISGCSYDPNKLSRTIETKQAAEPLVQLLKDYKNEHGVYPARVNDITLPKSVTDDIANYKIVYMAHNAGNAYTLAFNPPGPAFSCVYGAGFIGISARWQCLVK
jgi:hypothetical protein